MLVHIIKNSYLSKSLCIDHKRVRGEDIYSTTGHLQFVNEKKEELVAQRMELVTHIAYSDICRMIITEEYVYFLQISISSFYIMCILYLLY